MATQMTAMNLALVDSPSSQQIVRFNPKQYRMRQTGYDYGIKEAKRIKDWDMLKQAVDGKIAEQVQFIAWWYASVERPGGDRQSEKHSSGARLMPVREAEKLTGMKQPRVFELKSWLRTPDDYRKRLLGAAYRAAMLEAIPTYPILITDAIAMSPVRPRNLSNWRGRYWGKSTLMWQAMKNGNKTSKPNGTSLLLIMRSNRIGMGVCGATLHTPSQRSFISLISSFTN
jgi:hypothetical protein